MCICCTFVINLSRLSNPFIHHLYQLPPSCVNILSFILFSHWKMPYVPKHSFLYKKLNKQPSFLLFPSPFDISSATSTLSTNMIAEQWHYSSLWNINCIMWLIQKLILCSIIHETDCHITQSVERWITTTNKLITSTILHRIKISTQHRNLVIRRTVVASLNKNLPLLSTKLQPSIPH